MSLELGHLREVGVLGFPAAVAVRQPPPPSPAPAADAAPAVGKKEKGGKEKGGKEKGGKEKGGTASPPPAPAPTGPLPPEKTKAELKEMTKEERTQYWAIRRAHEKAAEKEKAEQEPALTKAQKRAAERAVQESKRKAKEDKANASKEGDELLAELKLQGLSDDQARAVMAEMKADESKADEQDDDDDDDAEDLLSSVRKWMCEQPDGKVSTDAMRDFNMKVRFQGHVDTTPPDHLGTILTILVGEACGKCDLAAPKIQPGLVAKALGPLLERWANLICGLHSKIHDVLEATGVIVGAITESVEKTGAPTQGQDCAVVGCLMAVRELDDFVEDEDLLVGCKSVEPKSHVLEKFIDFLEDAVEEDDDEDDGDDD